MDNKNIILTKIQNELSYIPANKLDDVEKYIKTLLSKKKYKQPKPVNLKGIWKNLGFDKIKNLEDEIHNIRKKLSDSIDKKMI